MEFGQSRQGVCIILMVFLLSSVEVVPRGVKKVILATNCLAEFVGHAVSK